MKYYKVLLTGIVTTDDGESHPDYWSWSDKDMPNRIKDMGNSVSIVITELKEVPAIDPAA